MDATEPRAVGLGAVGRRAWAAVGVLVCVLAAVAGVVLLLPYLAPLILAVVLAAVLLPAVEALVRHGIPRAASAAILTLVVPVVLAAVGFVVIRGLSGQAAQWRDTLAEAGRKLRERLGVDPVAGSVGEADPGQAVLGIAAGLLSGTAALLGIALSILIAFYVLFFLLKDARRFVDWVAARLPVPPDVTREALSGARLAMSRYMVGTTVIAALDTVAITVGAYFLHLPLLGVLAVVTFVAAYVPYVGAFVSGAMAVLVALGAGGVDAGAWMLGIVLVTQNILEGIARPLAFGAVLDLHPLVIMGVSVLGAALGGVLGVFVAPPAAAIAVSWYHLARNARSRPA